MRCWSVAAALLMTPVGTLVQASPSESVSDPAALRAGEANLESKARREGVTFSVAIGPSLTIGSAPVGTGTGGAVSLRLGHVATPSTVILFELEGAAQLHKNGTMGELVANNNTNLMTGAQSWIAPSLWVRAMAGVGRFQGNDIPIGPNPSANIVLVGPAGELGVGIDLARWRGAVLGLELYSINMVNRTGLLSANGLSMSLAFD